LKFVSCNKKDALINGTQKENAAINTTDIITTTYITKASLNADLVRQYFNLDSDTFEGSPVSFL
jgi:hypothetical protein